MKKALPLASILVLAMVQSFLLKILFFPFSLVYGFGVSLRNIAYQWGLLKSVRFDVPVIAVGNLSVGGAGKTPHIEYLICLLQDYLQIATLSRGYGRRTQGYLDVQPHLTAAETGDEPLQFKRKFPEAKVVVSESRTFGILRLLSEQPGTQVILLDDAFQHRAVTPGLNILLTEYSHPFTNDWLLPTGRLREWRSAYRRADVIIVTKCPPALQNSDRERLLRAINPFPHQRVFFSYYEYGRPYYLFDTHYQVDLQPSWQALVVAGIARSEYLTDYLQEQLDSVTILEYADHHLFAEADLIEIKATFVNMPVEQKIILTTEKDAVRLELHRRFIEENRLPVLVLPIQVQFHFGEGEQFDQLIRDFLLNFKA